MIPMPMPPGGTMVGLGIDLVSVDRLREAEARFGERLWQRVLTPVERDSLAGRRDPIPSLAARFAAKEAVAKALGCGIGAQLSFQDIQITRADAAPQMAITGPAVERLCAGLPPDSALQFHVSFSHERSHAVAIVAIITISS